MYQPKVQLINTNKIINLSNFLMTPPSWNQYHFYSTISSQQLSRKSRNLIPLPNQVHLLLNIFPAHSQQFFPTFPTKNFQNKLSLKSHQKKSRVKNSPYWNSVPMQMRNKYTITTRPLSVYSTPQVTEWTMCDVIVYMSINQQLYTMWNSLNGPYTICLFSN